MPDGGPVFGSYQQTKADTAGRTRARLSFAASGVSALTRRQEGRAVNPTDQSASASDTARRPSGRRVFSHGVREMSAASVSQARPGFVAGCGVFHFPSGWRTQRRPLHGALWIVSWGFTRLASRAFPGRCVQTPRRPVLHPVRACHSAPVRAGLFLLFTRCSDRLRGRCAFPAP